eukprot:TRINITY_DN2775_c0_g1_i1.p1 TRINITY_DN2775_c0_g1~~TRINITY_DN2775_c0_g1_i1.p1  ORF type:complete len:154 (-),score=49.37 TRINITY_DN2775_c0_g1_i1:105-566(-)
MSVSEQQKAEMLEAFSVFDRDGDGKISTKQIGNVMRALGLSPSEADLSQLITDAEKTYKDGNINFDALLKIVGPKMNTAMTEDQVIEAFRAFDKDGNGQIPAHELRHYMANIGEKLNEEELEDLKREMSQKEKNGLVNYPEMIRYMMETIKSK